MTIRREIFKTNSELTIAQYQDAYGNAGTALQAGRSGELVVDLADPTTPLLYIANNIGNLSLVGPGGSGTATFIANGTSNVRTFTGAVTVSANGTANAFGIVSDGASTSLYANGYTQVTGSGAGSTAFAVSTGDANLQGNTTVGGNLLVSTAANVVGNARVGGNLTVVTNANLQAQTTIANLQSSNLVANTGATPTHKIKVTVNGTAYWLFATDTQPT